MTTTGCTLFNYGLLHPGSLEPLQGLRHILISPQGLLIVIGDQGQRGDGQQLLITCPGVYRPQGGTIIAVKMISTPARCSSPSHCSRACRSAVGRIASEIPLR